jgi:hypothetical protein
MVFIGLLPLHLFARVTFNAPEQYLVVEGRRQLASLELADYAL